VAVLDPKNLLVSVDWRVRERFQALAKAFEAQTGLRLQVRSARRSCAEQAEQYGIGRTYNLDKPVVTHARGCQSWHVLGRAIDADIVDAAGKLKGDCKLYGIAGQIWEQQLQGIWGGRFGGFGECGDAGHFEWHPDVKLSELCPNPDACESAVLSVASVKPGAGLAGTLLAVSVLALGAAFGYGALR